VIEEAAAASEDVFDMDTAVAPLRAWASCPWTDARYRRLASATLSHASHPTSDVDAARKLAAELHSEVIILAGKLEDSPLLSESTSDPDRLDAWSHAAKARFDRLGSPGRQAARYLFSADGDPGRVDAGITQSWKPWWAPERASTADLGFALLTPLAWALWTERVGPALDRDRRRHHPAICQPLADSLGAAHRAGCRLEQTAAGGRLLDRNGIRLHDVEVPVVRLETVEVLEAGIRRFGSLAAYRLLTWEVTQGFTQVRQGVSDPRRIELRGGWGELARLVGSKSKKAPAELREIVLAQAQLVFCLPDGQRVNLLSLSERPASRGRAAHVVLVLGDMLLPHSTIAVPKTTRSGRLMRRLVPVVPLPPGVGNAPRLFGAQAALAFRLVTEFRRRCGELHLLGAAHLPPELIHREADTVGLSDTNTRKVIEAWVDTDHEAHFLVQVQKDHYRLCDRLLPAHVFLEEAGRREVEGLRRREGAGRRRGHGRKSSSR
jgi:hypothetical protein